MGLNVDGATFRLKLSLSTPPDDGYRFGFVDLLDENTLNFKREINLFLSHRHFDYLI